MQECHICYCVDKDFEKYAIASIISVFLNSKIKPKIHIICNKFTDKKKLGIAEKMFKTKFKYYLADDKPFYGLPVLGGYSAYYRILIPELLPKKIEKVLYLDCDTIIEDDLSGLFSIDLGKYALGAVEDIMVIKSDYKMAKKRLGIPIDKSYFNSGMMLLNLNEIRKKNLFSKVISYMRKNPQKLAMHDQDGLNAVLWNKWLKLPESYNWIININFIPRDNNPKIIHFAGLKPEMVRIISPMNVYCKKYYSYLDMTPLDKDEILNVDLQKLLKRIYEAIFKTKFFF